MKNRNREDVIKKATQITEGFINNLYFGDKKSNISAKTIYKVYGKVMIEDLKEKVPIDLRDFVETEINGENSILYCLDNIQIWVFYVIK